MSRAYGVAWLYPNLQAECEITKITYDALADVIGASPRAMPYKLRNGALKVQEAMLIHEELFPYMDFEELFGL